VEILAQEPALLLADEVPQGLDTQIPGSVTGLLGQCVYLLEGLEILVSLAAVGKVLGIEHLALVEGSLVGTQWSGVLDNGRQAGLHVEDAVRLQLLLLVHRHLPVFLQAALEGSRHGALTLDNDLQASGAAERRFLDAHVPALRKQAYDLRLEHHPDETTTLRLQDELAAVKNQLGVHGQSIGTQAGLAQPTDMHQLRTQVLWGSRPPEV